MEEWERSFLYTIQEMLKIKYFSYVAWKRSHYNFFFKLTTVS